LTTDDGYTEPSWSVGLPDVTIRPAREPDGAGIGDVWLAAWRATFDFPPSHPDDDVRTWLATELLATRETWVATEPDGRVVAVLALTDDMIDQLYVTPDRIGTGIGSRLIATAKARRPDGLDLYCFAANMRARTFYEHHGFVVIATGDGSTNSERQPDIRYSWRPDR
jgi:GNAT superfamily N-acetyltransferase